MDVTLGQVSTADRWLGNLEARGFSPETVRAYRRAHTEWEKYINRLGITDPQVGVIEAEGYLHKLMSEGRAPKTAHKKIGALRGYFRYLRKHGMVQDNPFDRLDPIKLDKPLPRFLDPVQAEAVIKQAPKTGKRKLLRRRDLVIVELLYASGVRVAELCGIEMPDVNLDRGTVRVMGKGRKERLVPIGDHAVKAIRAYLPDRQKQLDRIGRPLEAALLVGQKGKLMQRQVRVILTRIAQALKLPEGLHPHMLRHSYATHLYGNGVDLLALRDLLGHESVRSTEIYTHTSIDSLHEKYKNAHPRA